MNDGPIAIPPHVREMMRTAQAGRPALERLPATVDGLKFRRELAAGLGIDLQTPRRWFTGWYIDSRLARQTPDGLRGDTRAIVSSAPYEDAEWLHASISHPDRLPSYDELKALHRAAFVGPAYQVFAAAADHVDIHPFTLHLWGRLDGARSLPDFGRLGTI